MKRRKVYVGTVPMGDGEKISIQSMTNTDTKNIEQTLEQIAALQEAGCDIVRLAVYDREAAVCFGQIKAHTSLPLVADIHFDYKIALDCIANGADKIRLNPGNIGGMDKVKAVAKAAAERRIPIRIGVNSGSIEKDLLLKYGKPTAEAMVESALSHIQMLEACDFDDIVISLKASSVPMTVQAYRLMHKKVPYPLHIGVTEAGTAYSGLIKSSVGIGSLLLDGIGDTIRVSLTANPVEEVRAAKQILCTAGLREMPILISCPTCGRTRIDLIPIAQEVEQRLSVIEKPITVAVMGCVVNGPGEAKHADIGIAGGDGCAVLFKHGEIIKKVPEEDILSELFQEIDKM